MLAGQFGVGIAENKIGYAIVLAVHVVSNMYTCMYMCHGPEKSMQECGKV